MKTRQDLIQSLLSKSRTCVIGAGKSRNNIDLTSLPERLIIIGCHDVLKLTDPDIVATRKKVPTRNVISPEAGVPSGVAALRFALNQLGAKNVILLGFDGGTEYNRYVDLYLAEIALNPDVNFLHVDARHKWSSDLPNYYQVTIKEFKNYMG